METEGYTFQATVTIPVDRIQKMRNALATEQGMMRNKEFRESEYLRGLHNGMEMLMACMDGRNPKLIRKDNKGAEEIDGA